MATAGTPPSAPIPAAEERRELRRGAVGFGGILFQSITFMAPAIATAFSIPIGISFAGGAAPLAVIVALIASLCVASSVAQMAKHMPTAGSFYTYVSTSIHPLLGFLVAWAFELALLVGAAFLALQTALIVAPTLTAEYDVSANLWWPWAILGAVLVFMLGYFGIKATTRVGVILGIFEIGVILALAITLIVKAGGDNTARVFTTHFANNPDFRGFSGIFAASVFSVLAFIGFEEAAPLAEEAHEPRRHVQLAVVLSALIIGIFYLINTYASTVFYGPDRMVGFVNAGDGNPWQNLLARNAWGGFGFLIVFLALLNSAIANLNAANNSSSRNLYAMGRIRLLPRAFTALNRRYGSPYVGLGVMLIITIGVALWLGFQYDLLTAFALTATVIVDMFTPIYILLNVACIVYFLRFRRAEFNWVLHLLLPLVGIAAFVPAFLTGAGLPAFNFISRLPKPLSYAGPAAGIWMVIGIVYLLYLRARHPERIEQTRRIFVEEGPAPAP
ncbi:MAG TPA: APC family permease [Actinomycetota bacterium]|nr:APC family permease [Actinomycetota bacterium]